MPIPLSTTLVFSNVLLFLCQISYAIDTITQSQSLRDGSSMVSNDGTFELGFFTPGSSTNRYVGIWYNNIPVQTVVWVANRDRPINDNSSFLSITKEGNLVLLSKNHTLIWSTNATTNTKPLNPIVQLLDTGNLVIRDRDNEESFSWQSFDHPCNVFLPGMKLGWDRKTGLNRHLTAWKNWDDPSLGLYTYGIVLSSNPEVVMWKGSMEYYRSGPWNGVQFNGVPALKVNPVFDYKFVNNEDEVYYTYALKKKGVISIVVINQTLSLRQRFIWSSEERSWKLYQSVPRDICDGYNRCGPYGNCNVDVSTTCQCIDGFEPKSAQNWDVMDWTEGCVRNKGWSCRVKGKDGFRRFTNMKLPDTTHSWVDETMTLEDCKIKCFQNCSCTGFANLDPRAGTGCAIWFGQLLDIRVFSEGGGQDLYIRMPASQTDDVKKRITLVITVSLFLVLVMLLSCSYIYKTKRKNREKTKKNLSPEKRDEEKDEDLELPLYDFDTIVDATDGFSIDKKLGEGGFGPVYMGTLADGKRIAVKRLSRGSRQGLQEFKNEVILCAKLQHRNLVKVIGYCIEGEEKMLLYEYMANRSLDSFIFDSIQAKRLDWSKRLNIIKGISRGLLYLHHDSRLRIIHRDLKTSNILLDNEMNPKISDFGLARMCRGDQVEGNTRRVVGTYGYMAPEYAIDGLFSIKSDVFSFGILLLEIISGKKNNGRSIPSNEHNLIGYAWRLWKEGNSMNLTDPCLRGSCILSEVVRCIHIGLLCIQLHPDDRPNMTSVVLMLSSDIVLSKPKEPGFLLEIVTVQGESSISNMVSFSTNELSASELEAR